MVSTRRSPNAKVALSLASLLAFVAGNAFGQQGLLPNDPTQAPAAQSKLGAAEQEAKIAKERTAMPIELKTFFQQVVGTKENEIVQESEIEDILNKFEYQFGVLIPDRDVLITSSLTTKDLILALRQRIEQTPGGAGELPLAAISINGNNKQNWESVKPFQRRDLLNNPGRMLKDVLSAPGLTDGAGGAYSASGALNSASGLGYPKVDLETVVARAILDLRPDIGDPSKADPVSLRLAALRRSNAAITKADYALLVREFLNGPSEKDFKASGIADRDLLGPTSQTDRIDDDWFRLRIAVFRQYQQAATQNYSNGRSRFDAQGNEVYPNGRRKVDDSGQPLYSNGRPKSDPTGRPLHSNGMPKYSSGGVPLYANGTMKKSQTGRDLYRAGGQKTSERGAPLYENGRPRVDVAGGSAGTADRLPTQAARKDTIAQIGVPLSPDGKELIREEDGAKLYENSRPIGNERGEPLYKNQQKRLAANGQSLYDNGRKTTAPRGQALTYEGSKIAGTFGFQGRPDGNFPIASFLSARLVKVDNEDMTIALDEGQEERTFSLEQVFVGRADGSAAPVDPATITKNASLKVVSMQTTKYSDGQRLASVGEPAVLAVFTSSGKAKPETGDVRVLRLYEGSIADASDESIELRVPTEGKLLTIRTTESSAQKTSGLNILPVSAKGVTRGRRVTILAESIVRFENGTATTSSAPSAVIVWQH